MKRNIWLVIFTIFIMLFYINSLDLNAENSEHFLKGDGTEENPYLIESVSDFVLFRDNVNAGEEYRDSFFAQTLDIDLGSEKEWEPIGLFDGGNYFYGTYDGCGHSILNITINEGGNCGLFGVLGGTVKNLGIESGYISGNCVGAIASHAVSNGASIINCYNKATLVGYRVGGIADNFTGGIIENCWNIGELSGGTVAQIVGYDAQSIIGCLGVSENDLCGTTFTGKTLYNNVSSAEILNRRSVLFSCYSKVYEDALALRTCFEGDGTETFPYIIGSREDLELFAYLVNLGITFDGKYVKQTVDIDLNGMEWMPIGIFDSGKYFYGTYDGAGHVITNIRITDGGNCGFFGVLGGTVMNLGIESGNISGDCVGAITSHAAKDGVKIINCYNKAKVKGMYRAGGIADNLTNGSIENCWNAGFLVGDTVGQVVSYDAKSIIDCAGTASNEMHGELFAGREINSSSFAVSNYNEMFEEFSHYSKIYEDALEQKICFEGDGTEIFPYIIGSREDLVAFAYLVNLGIDFDGKHVKQTVDIDLNGMEWIPIGIFDSGKYFYGTYDGAGHVITNIRITDGGNCGFFGVLGGTVMNLGIESGNISGDCVGAITSHAAKDGVKIINCYNKAKVKGMYRAGGIADNLTNGQIICCWNSGKIIAPSNGDIVGYNAEYLVSCLSMSDNVLFGDDCTAMLVDCVSNDGVKVSELESKFLSNSTGTYDYLGELFRKYIKGEGTEKDPYVVAGKEEAACFSYLVNNGYGFDEEYIVQKKDIDLDGVNWKPIGVFGGENYFYGTYDGLGHYISNLVVEDGGCCGLFGILGGTVMNLGIESGKLSGSCVGAIASHSTGYEPKIINCYNKASVTGTERAGGIADNFGGGIISNCWNVGEIVSPIRGEIVSWDAKYIYDCSLVYDKEYTSANYRGQIIECSEHISSIDLLLNNFRDNVSKQFLSLENLADQYFDGEGTENNPYRIKNESDFIRFREFVNAGITFEKKWIRQESDIEFTSDNRQEPIGMLGGQFFFCGVYDGNGHTLSNVVIDCDADAALFAPLGGTIMNLGIESGTIKGLNAASIACGGRNIPMVINCYNKADVAGVESAGGIANDLTSGIIANCINYSVVKSRDASEICGRDAERVMYCQSINDAPFVPDSFSGKYEKTNIVFNTDEESVYYFNKVLYKISTYTCYQRDNLNELSYSGKFGAKYKYRLAFCIRSTILLLGLIAMSCVATLLVWFFDIKKEDVSCKFGIEYIKARVDRICKRIDKQIAIFTGIYVFFASIFLAFVLNGDYGAIHNSLSYFPDGVFMDFFDPLVSVMKNNYLTSGFYSNNEGTYPPLARLVFWLFGRLVSVSDALSGSSVLRMRGQTAIPFVILLVLSYAIIASSFNKISKTKFWGYIIVVTSLPLWYAAERGNIIFIAIAFTGLFLVLYENENEAIRIISYICLSVAAAIKIYPAIYVILVFGRKKKREIIEVCIVGLIFAFVPFIVCGGGDVISDYFHIVTAIGKGTSGKIMWKIDYTNDIIFLCSRLGWSIEAGRIFAKYSRYALTAFLVIASMVCKERYKKVLAATLILVLFPLVSVYYVSAFYIFPLAFWLSEKKKFTALDYCYFGALVLPILPLQVLVGVIGVSLDIITIGTGLISVLIALIVAIDGIINFIKDIRMVVISKNAQKNDVGK